MKTILLTLALLAAASAEQAGAIEHIFDTADATRIKSEIVSAMLDANFTLTDDTQYKLVFGKQVNLHPTGEAVHPTQGALFPGIVSVSFTVVPQSDKTRLSVFCVVTGRSHVFEAGGQRRYDAWLNEFCRRLTAKIEKTVSLQSNSLLPNATEVRSMSQEEQARFQAWLRQWQPTPCVKDASLSMDTVRLEPGAASKIRSGYFFPTQPAKRPDYVPTEYIPAKVLGNDGKFLGWQYFAPAQLEYMHEQ